MKVPSPEYLLKLLHTSKLCLLLTTGRSGTDFLQSLYDQHPNVMSTCEKNLGLQALIQNDFFTLMANDPELAASITLPQLIESFAPYIDSVEGWGIKPTDNYNNADPTKYVYILKLFFQSGEIKNPLLVAKAIIISFSLSLDSPPPDPKVILFHLHHIGQLEYYSNHLAPEDKILVCSRNPFSLIYSGVTSWNKYYFARGSYLGLHNLAHYEKLLDRSFNEHALISQLSISKESLLLPVLDNLSDINYLNKINNFLGIKLFTTYPNSTVFNVKRRPDKLSQLNASKASKESSSSFNHAIVNRGNPEKLLGLIESINICCIHSERLIYYNQVPNSYLLKKATYLPRHTRILITIILMPVPSKIEIHYLLKILSNFSNAILKKKRYLSASQTLIALGQFINSYFKIRSNRIRNLALSSSRIGFIPEP